MMKIKKQRKMKRILFIALILIPFFASAQNERKFYGSEKFASDTLTAYRFKINSIAYGAAADSVLVRSANGDVKMRNASAFGTTITPAALTKTDDTNVTLTLGGTPSTALLQGVSITAGWSGTLAPTRGGTGIGTYTTGDLLYASASNVLSKRAIGSTDDVLTVSGGVPVWQAPTFKVVSTSGLGASQTATTTLLSYTTPNDGSLHLYDVAAMINVSAVAAGVLTVTVTYFDEDNVSRTLTYYSMGTTSAGLTVTGKSNFPVMGEVYSYPNTAVTITATLVGGTMTYLGSATIIEKSTYPL